MKLSNDRRDAARNTEGRTPAAGSVWRRVARRLPHAGGSRAVTLAGVAIAVAAAPVAMAAGGGWGSHWRGHAARHRQAPLRGAIHNPPFGAFSRPTGIFANDGGWVTRIKNQGGGGAGVLLCGSAAGRNACLASENSAAGMAFDFTSNGATGGTIQLKNEGGAPFTTDAHGVATGLNANYLQGKQASEFQLASKPAADSEELGGQKPSAYAAASQLMFADVSAGATPKLENTSGATAVTLSGSTYTVTFGKADVSKCSYTASPLGGALAGGQLGVAPDPAEKAAVTVTGPTGFSGGFDLQVICA